MKHSPLLLFPLVLLSLGFYWFLFGFAQLPIQMLIDSEKTDKSVGISEKHHMEDTQFASISVDRMNILYAGISNPITITAVKLEDLNVSCTNCSIEKRRGQQYNVRVSQPGQIATITLSSTDLKPIAYKFRIKRLPDPTACLGNCRKKGMGTGEFKGQEGIYAALYNFDISIRYSIEGYQVIRIPSNGKSVRLYNEGGRYTSETINLINSAQPGDIYCFRSIKVRGPGDKQAREIGDIVMDIK